MSAPSAAKRLQTPGSATSRHGARNPVEVQVLSSAFHGLERFLSSSPPPSPYSVRERRRRRQEGRAGSSPSRSAGARRWRQSGQLRCSRSGPGRRVAPRGRASRPSSAPLKLPAKAAALFSWSSQPPPELIKARCPTSGESGPERQHRRPDRRPRPATEGDHHIAAIEDLVSPRVGAATRAVRSRSREQRTRRFGRSLRKHRLIAGPWS
jgi:hypothetical protein